MANEKRVYLVKSPLSHDLEHYEVGDDIELSYKEAKPLMIAGVIELAKSVAKPNDPPPSPPPDDQSPGTENSSTGVV